MSEQQKRGAEWLADVAKRMQKEKDNENRPIAENLTIRELVRKFGYYKRSRNVVGEIRKGLEDNKLNITPDSFDNEYLDNEVQITLRELESTAADKKLEQLTVRIDSLDAAHNEPISVKPSDPLVRATTIMQFWNYSQLPIIEKERDVQGVISWRSIGEVYAHGQNPKTVQDCNEKAHIVEVTMPLLDAANEIYKHDYVLVSGRDKRIIGIVTAADIAYEFKQLAHPFLLIGEIEGYLRGIIRGKFTIEDLKHISDSDKDISGPHDLTFGNYIRLLEDPKKWDVLKLNFDRKEFINQLSLIRIIRNSIMHFSVDSLEDEEIMRLDCMVSLLRKWRAHSG